jgi:FixJ family two-component response regulator
MTNCTATIHVVDDDASFRTATGELLTACGYPVALYASADELLKAPLGKNPACILLDVQMSGLGGPQLQERLSEIGCRLPIVFITGHGDIPTSVKTIKAGAEDFLTKPVAKDQLVGAIERALAHYEKTSVHAAEMESLGSRLSRLTPRELEVFHLLVRGKPHKQVAYVLGVSERTIKSHRHSIVEKLQVRSLAELAAIAERLGLLHDAEPPLNGSPMSGTALKAGAQPKPSA